VANRKIRSDRPYPRSKNVIRYRPNGAWRTGWRESPEESVAADAEPARLALNGTEIVMRAVLQRVSRARVVVDGEVIGEIGRGLLVLLGVAPTDLPEQARWLAEKIVGLRVFEDDAGKMNRDVAEVGGGVLVVSQFTLYGECAKGRRPSFIGAAPPDIAIPLYEAFVNAVRAQGIPTATGRFGAMMHVELVNEGPVTLILDRDA
jgi:D-tyrosyl-tRNA(Tyr) deacylase